MTRSPKVAALGIGLLMSLLVAPAALADTCCTNVPVVLDPPSARPGATVRLIGMQCLNYDGSQTNRLPLGRFLLTSRAPEMPDTGPTAAGLPPIESWLTFKRVPDPSVATGDALIVIPDLPNGQYQLWWWCDDGSGLGGSIHYSTGPKLQIGPAAPDTAIEPNVPADTPVGPGAALLSLFGVVFILAVPTWRSGDSIVAVDVWCLRDDERAVAQVSAVAWVRSP